MGTVTEQAATVCQGQTIGSTVTLSRRDLDLADVGNTGEEGLCSVAYLSLLPSALVQKRCVCDQSVVDLDNPCAQLPGNKANAMCHPDQCFESDSDTPVIRVVLDEPYSVFSAKHLQQLTKALETQIARLLGVSSVKVEIIDVQPVIPSIVARFEANYQTAVLLTVQEASESDMEAVASAMSSGDINLGIPLLAVQTLDQSVPVPTVPSSGPSNVPVPVPMPVPVPNPVPVPVQIPVPVPVPVPASASEDNEASRAVSIKQGLTAILLVVVLLVL